MAIKVSQAFSRTSANPIDESMALTKAQMLTVNDNLMPAYYFTICQDDGEIYLYDKTATASATTGKFKKFEGGGGGGGGTGGLIIDATLTAVGWNSTTKQQTITFTGYESSMGGVIGMPIAATAAQKDAYAEAKIDAISQSGTSFTFECEEIPAIDLPVTLYAGGAGGGGGASLPDGGATGQALVKKSNADQDVEWGDVSGEQIQYDTMPTASATNLGQIVQYIGTTDANYTNGLFYECVSDGQSTPTYGWAVKDVQTYPEVNLTNVFASGFPVASVSGDRRFQYSTDEQIVGTWIDGKPIYQKTFTGTVPAFTPPSDSVLDPATLDIAMDCLVDVFVSVSGFIQTVAGNYVPLPFTEITKNVTYKESSSATTLDSYSQTIAAYGRPNASTSMPNYIRVVNMNQNFNNRPLCVTAQYTKTTD